MKYLFQIRTNKALYTLNFMKIHFLLVFPAIFFFFNIANSQSLTEQKVKYTRADTLRGMLRPERTCYDVTFYELNVKVDTTTLSITGSNRIVFNTLQDFKTMQIDLFDTMSIKEITTPDGKRLKYRRDSNAVFVEMPETIKKGDRAEIIVQYYGKPIIAKYPPWEGGFTWTHDSTGSFWAGVSCEGMGASSWWPCKDYLGDEPDSMRIICTVPNGLQDISNGLEERVVSNADNTTTFYWMVHYPINNYDVTLNIANYAHFSDEYTAMDGSKLALNYYVLPYDLERARIQFQQVKPMLRCYEKYLGKYPFWNDGYKLVQTSYLGMEHQEAISYGNRYLNGYLGRDYSRIGLHFDYIIIHESAHEWWGNSVSCSDLADMWIHEAFATYTESLYVDCMYGPDTALLYINAKKRYVGNKEPIVGTYGVNQQGSGDMYEKGSLFLNTLRHVVNNDKVWWSTFKGACDTAFKYKTTNYNEIVAYFDKKTGLKLDDLFEQYLKYPKIPVLQYRLKKKRKSFEMTYRWITDVKNFNMPFVITTNDGSQRLNATNDWQTTPIKIQKASDLVIDDDLMYFEEKKD